MKRRILPLLLAVAMILAMLPVTAMAANLPGADGGVITITEGGEYTIDSSIGGRIVVNAPEEDVILNVTGEVAVDDLAVKVPFITNTAGHVTIQGSGKLTRSEQANVHYIVLNHDVMEITGEVTIANTIAASSSNSSTVNNFGTLTVSGGTISANGFIALKNDAEEPTEKLEGNENKVGGLSVTGGRIEATGNAATGILNWGNATISGGIVESQMALGTWVSPNWTEATTLIEDGATIIGAVQTNKHPTKEVADVSGLPFAKITITGGSFVRTHSQVPYPRNVQACSYDVNLGNGQLVTGLDTDTIEVSGGTFTRAIDSEYVSEEVAAVKVVNEGNYKSIVDAASQPAYTYLSAEEFETEFAAAEVGPTNLYTSAGAAPYAAQGYNTLTSTDTPAVLTKVDVTLLTIEEAEEAEGEEEGEEEDETEPEEAEPVEYDKYENVVTGSYVKLPTDLTLEGYEFKGWEDEDGETYTDCIVVEDAITLTAVWEEEKKVTPTPPVNDDDDDNTGEEPVETGFVDVPATAYFAKAVSWAAEKGIVSGKTETTFAPNDPATRAQFVAYLWRAADRPEPETTENPFTDVKETDYYYKAVLWAVENKIVAGTSNTTFSPDLECTRAQAITFLWRFEGRQDASDVNGFTDIPADSYYTTAAAWGVENKIIYGITNTTFAPNNDCTRAQSVTFLYRDLA